MNAGLCAIAAAIAVGMGCLSAIGEGLICSHSIDGMVRNPEMAGKLRTNMMVAVALDESTAIYALVVSLLILFMMGLPALNQGI
ncbi:MAG: ATP synthase F0 subunit C [Bacilli bacterium]|nr:ATP synthase F0 subunit C [Bacilli bacterium]